MNDRFDVSLAIRRRTAMGDQKIEEMERAELESAERQEAEKKAQKDEFRSRLLRFIKGYFPDLSLYLVDDFEEWNQWAQEWSVDVTIPGYSLIRLNLDLRPDIRFVNAEYQFVSFRKPTFEELGFVHDEMIVPYWRWNTQGSKDIDLTLAYAKRQYALMDEALGEWMEVKAGLIRDHELEVQETNRRNEEFLARQEAEPKRLLTCSIAERDLLDAIMNYVNWANDESE